MKKTGIVLLVIAPIIAVVSALLVVCMVHSAVGGFNAATGTADTLEELKAEINSVTSDLSCAYTPLWIGGPTATLSFVAGLALLITGLTRAHLPTQRTDIRETRSQQPRQIVR